MADQGPYGSTFFDDKRTEERRLQQALRDALPSFLTDGHGVAGPNGGRRVSPASPFPPGRVHREPPQPFFPETPATETVAGVTAFVPTIAFYPSNGSTNVDGSLVYKVAIYDGKLDGEFPAGMGAGNYVLTVDDPNDCIIYVGSTFNPTTLAITSRFLALSTAADFPESRVESDTEGFLYWQLGFTFLDGEAFKVVVTRLGDIHTTLIYASANGQPALWAGPEIGMLDLEFGP